MGAKIVKTGCLGAIVYEIAIVCQMLRQFLCVSDIEVENCDLLELDASTRHIIEADSFWCTSRLLDGIQDNYTFAQPGIQMKVNALRELIKRIDGQFTHPCKAVVFWGHVARARRMSSLPVCGLGGFCLCKNYPDTCVGLSPLDR